MNADFPCCTLHRLRGVLSTQLMIHGWRIALVATAHHASIYLRRAQNIGLSIMLCTLRNRYLHFNHLGRGNKHCQHHRFKFNSLTRGDPERDEVPPMSCSASNVTDEEVAVLFDYVGKRSEAHINQLLSMGDGSNAESKKIQALGAFDGQHRSQALDMLGFKKQVIFSTLSAKAPFSTRLDTRVKYALCARMNRT